MKTLLSASVAAVLLAGAANAADMPVKAPEPPAPVWTWDGVYVGASGGYSWGRWNTTCPFTTVSCAVGTPGTFTEIDAFLASFTSTPPHPKLTAGVAGTHLGRNWQYQNWVVGVEWEIATGERRRLDGTTTLDQDLGFFIITTSRSILTEWKFRWFSTARGRLGWANDTWLVYLTGGVAAGSASLTRTVTDNGLGGTIETPLSEAKTKWGFAVGGGVEKAFTQNLVGRAEYLYVDLGTHRFFDNVLLNGERWDTDVRLHDHIARIGLSYLFNPWISARY
jgi:outer membrane immunogenic protein